MLEYMYGKWQEIREVVVNISYITCFKGSYMEAYYWMSFNKDIDVTELGTKTKR